MKIKLLLKNGKLEMEAISSEIDINILGIIKFYKGSNESISEKLPRMVYRYFMNRKKIEEGIEYIFTCPTCKQTEWTNNDSTCTNCGTSLQEFSNSSIKWYTRDNKEIYPKVKFRDTFKVIN